MEMIAGKGRKAFPVRERAYSLVEFMTVITIVSILLMLAVPGFRAADQHQRLTAAANDFFADIHLTRSEALHRGTRVDMVPADGTDWARGWVVFVDGNGNQVPDAGETLIYMRGPVAEGISIKAVFTDSSRQYLAYNGTGRTRTNANSQTPQLGTISFFLESKIRRIKVNFLGRPRACNPDTDSSCTGSGEPE